MRLKSWAKKLPNPIENTLKRYIYRYIVPSTRFDKTFWDTFNFLKESQWWSQEKLEEYQMRQLAKLLNHAYENVPYYRKMFDDRGLKPKNIQNFDDLRKLPFLTKDKFKQHFAELVIKNVKLTGLPMRSTSGTTGKPLQFYENSNTEQKELAFIHHQWSRVGFKPADPMIKLKGAIIRSNKPVDFDRINKVLRLSPRIDSKEIVRYYLEKMQQFGASFFHGYPSTIGVFASMIKKYGFSVPFRLKAVLFASEAIYPWEREVTQEVFNCRIYSHYGATEKVVLAGECQHTPYYHFIPQYGITELDIDTNEIIGTGFLNYVNPFIRYRTTDIASQPVASGCEACGRQYYPVFSSVEGRLEDFIITPMGVPISPAVITHPFKKFETIRDTQIIQKSLNCIKLRIVTWDNCDPKILRRELHQLCKGLQNIVGTDIKIETEQVESVQLSKSGKFKWIISEVSKDFLERGIDRI